MAENPKRYEYCSYDEFEKIQSYETKYKLEYDNG